MSRVLPILFNTDMVRAILDRRKTATRRKVNIDIANQFDVEHDGRTVIAYIDQATGDSYNSERICRYQIGDILYIRETWAFMPCIGCNGEYARPGVGMACYDTQAVEYDDGNSISDGCFVYRADCKKPERICWRPSIHMPKEAARIFLKVKDVRVERLQAMTLDDFLSEGVTIRPEAFNDPDNAYLQARDVFVKVWDSTVKKEQIYLYGWDGNPWVWTIEFERCGKPEEL